MSRETDRLSQSEAKQHCKNAYNGTLAILSNSQRFADMRNCVMKRNKVKMTFWIGLSKRNTGFVWDDGTLFAEETAGLQWNKKQGESMCVTVNKFLKKWTFRRQEACSDHYRPICEYANC
ncbi:uncharacterized protein LOC121385741 [Gigantopelta aegis]|uniref:uncharacterized protein LOC121385741 n=1 Tax=Gigantopelta aegis TaxID=1735272 RepID=UPI001B88D30F|nr:uncharacterized protein LOC121385741 [Gigantopelta aegis]